MTIQMTIDRSIIRQCAAALFPYVLSEGTGDAAKQMKPEPKYVPTPAKGAGDILKQMEP
jgi:hypothetical protein